MSRVVSPFHEESSSTVERAELSHVRNAEEVFASRCCSPVKIVTSPNLIHFSKPTPCRKLSRAEKEEERANVEPHRSLTLPFAHSIDVRITKWMK